MEVANGGPGDLADRTTEPERHHRCALIWVRRIDAEAMRRVRSAATAVNFVGGTRLGWVGQLMRTTLGWPLGSTSSMRRSAPLMVPVDRVVDLFTGSSLFQVGDPQPRREFAVPGGALTLHGLVDLGLSPLLQTVC
jgi:hypothetical protein